MEKFYVLNREELMDLVEMARKPEKIVMARVKSTHSHSQPRTYRRAVVDQFIATNNPRTIVQD